MRNLSLFSKALPAAALFVSLLLGSCNDSVDPASTLSLHALLADAMEMDMNQDTLMNPSGQPVTNEGGIPGAGIEAITKKEDLEANIKEQKELNETLINGLCKGRGKDCLPAVLTRIGENCNSGKCFDFSKIRRWACIFDQQITITITDLQGNQVLNSPPGNEKERFDGRLRGIPVPEGLGPGQRYIIDIQSPDFPAQRLEGRF